MFYITHFNCLYMHYYVHGIFSSLYGSVIVWGFTPLAVITVNLVALLARGQRPPFNYSWSRPRYANNTTPLLRCRTQWGQALTINISCVHFVRLDYSRLPSHFYCIPVAMILITLGVSAPCSLSGVCVVLPGIHSAYASLQSRVQSAVCTYYRTVFINKFVT